jgi:hypothetical protein
MRDTEASDGGLFEANDMAPAGGKAGAILRGVLSCGRHCIFTSIRQKARPQNRS